MGYCGKIGERGSNCFHAMQKEVKSRASWNEWSMNDFCTRCPETDVQQTYNVQLNGKDTRKGLNESSATQLTVVSLVTSVCISACSHHHSPVFHL